MPQFWVCSKISLFKTRYFLWSLTHWTLHNLHFLHLVHLYLNQPKQECTLLFESFPGNTTEVTTHPEFNEEKCSRWSLVVEIFKTAFTFGKLVVNLPNIDCLQEIWLVETGATMKDYKLAVVPREEDLSRWTTHRYGRINACDTEKTTNRSWRGEDKCQGKVGK